MDRKWVIIVVIFVLALALAAPAKAISNGTPDEGEHPYVVMLVFYDGEEVIWHCSGSMLSDRVILTAAHCIVPRDDIPLDSARVYPAETIEADLENKIYPDEGYYYSDTLIPYPGFSWSLPVPETYDIGLVILDEPVQDITEFAQLPPPYYMDEFLKSEKRDVILTTVGYGYNTGFPTYDWFGTRYMAQSFLIHLENWTDGWNIQFSSNPGNWMGSEDYVTGGPCSGDSGGPTLFGGPESNLIVGIVYGVNSYYCTGWGVAWRVDIAPSLDFIAGVLQEYDLTLP